MAAEATLRKRPLQDEAAAAAEASKRQRVQQLLSSAAGSSVQVFSESLASRRGCPPWLRAVVVEARYVFYTERVSASKGTREKIAVRSDHRDPARKSLHKPIDGLHHADIRLPHEESNPYWVGIGPHGAKRAIQPLPGHKLLQLTYTCDFGSRPASEVQQILDEYAGQKPHEVVVLALHGGQTHELDDDLRSGWLRQKKYEKGVCRPQWNTTDSCTGQVRMHSRQISEELYNLAGDRVCFESRNKSSNSRNNIWGHVHSKLILSLFEKTEGSGIGTRSLRVSVFTHGPFGQINGGLEYAVWSSPEFPVRLSFSLSSRARARVRVCHLRAVLLPNRWVR